MPATASGAIAPRADRRIGRQEQLRARIKWFRTGTKTMKASCAARQAQVEITRSFAGVGQGMSGVGETLYRADARVQGMRDEADAMDGLIRSGVLEDPLDGRSPQQRDLAAIRATSAVDDELARLKADVRPATEGPGG